MSKQLEKHLDAARTQAPLLSAAEVSTLLAHPGKVVVKKRLLHFKTVMIMSMLTTCLLAGFIWLWQSPSPVPARVIPSGTSEGVNKYPHDTAAAYHTSKPASHGYTPYTRPFDTIPADVKAHNEQLLFSWYEPPMHVQQPEPYLRERDYFDEYGNLVLNETELARLGIMTDGNILTYRNVVDTVSRWTMHANKPPYPAGLYFFRLTVNASGTTAIQNTVMDSAQLRLDSRIFWPAFVYDYTDKDTQVYAAEYITLLQQQKRSFAREARGYCIPVKVSTQGAGATKRTKDHTFIFWFKAQQAFIDALPEGARTALQHQVNQTDMAGYVRMLRMYSFIHTQQDFAAELDSQTITSLQKTVVTLTPQGLKQVHVNTTKGGFVFKGYLYLGNQLKKLTLKQKVNGSFTSIRSEGVRSATTDTAVTLVAYSSYALDYFQFYYQYPDSIAQSRALELSSAQFARECNTLIPIKAGYNRILWFKPTPYLLQVVEQYQLARP